MNQFIREAAGVGLPAIALHNLERNFPY